MPKGKNAFFFFAEDWKTQEERKGHKFPGGLKQVLGDPNCNKAWQKLSKEDRVLYKEKEKNYKIIIKADKKTATGKSLEILKKEEIEEKKFINNMIEYISSTVKEAKKNNNVQNLKFYVIHINYFYFRILEENQTSYCPAEIAIAEFSLEEGVTRCYTKIVNPKIELGYSSLAAEHSSNTHQIPKNSNDEKNYKENLYKEICKFLEPGTINGKLPPLYTLYKMEHVKNSAISVLHDLAATETSQNLVKDFVIYSFEELLVHLHNINIKENSTQKFEDAIGYAFTEIKQCPFDCNKNIQCKFHQTLVGGGNHCSKSFVYNWIFILCSYCCPLMEIKIVPGRHTAPKQSDNTNNSNINESEFRTVTKEKKKKQQQTQDTDDINEIKNKHYSERTDAEKEKLRAASMLRPLTLIQYTPDM